VIEPETLFPLTTQFAAAGIAAAVTAADESEELEEVMVSSMSEMLETSD
jgi:hypothetical protein